jgi:hypothetical protein
MITDARIRQKILARSLMSPTPAGVARRAPAREGTRRLPKAAGGSPRLATADVAEIT